MIERVALAISGGDDAASILAIHRHRARAALEAMREPTDDMLDAGMIHCGVDLKSEYSAMIAAALSGGEAGLLIKDANRMFSYNSSAEIQSGALQSKTPWVAPINPLAHEQTK